MQESKIVHNGVKIVMSSYLNFHQFMFLSQRENITEGSSTKAKSAKKCTFFSQTDFLPCEFLLIKKLEIEKTKTTFIISVLKVVY